ncbi:MAG: chemotaxis protein CheW [Verrucomicrobia bacterium]|nr:chemotaxis protein CheW [Verrucomicrobiota bacterium]
MLFLLCETRAGRFVIPGQRILEVLPMIAVSPLAGMPPGMAGVMRCRGVSAPVLDLTQLTTGAPAPCRMSTRVLLAGFNNASGAEQLMGVIVERATRMVSIPPDQFSEVAAETGPLSFLRAVAWDGGVAVRRVDLDRLGDLLTRWMGAEEAALRIAA